MSMMNKLGCGINQQFQEYLIIIIMLLFFVFEFVSSQDLLESQGTNNLFAQQRKLLQLNNNFSCEVELDIFKDSCQLQNQLISSEQTNNTLSACCWDANCCTKLDRLFDSGCIDACTDDVKLLELSGMYSEICPGSHVQLNTQNCQPKKQNKNICDILNSNMVSDCGGIQGLNFSTNEAIEQGHQQFGGCCWDDVCCDQASMYISMGCASECHKNMHHQKYGKGNAIAKFWAGACNLQISKITTCEAIQWIQNWSDQSKQQIALKSANQPQRENDEFPAQEPNNNNNNNITNTLEINHSELYRKALKQNFTLGNQNQTIAINSDNFNNNSNNTNYNSSCAQNGSYYLYGPQMLWNLTAFSFCNHEDVHNLGDNSNEFQLCCTIIQELVYGVCKFKKCFDNEQLPNEYNTTTGSLIQSWKNKCKIASDNTCNNIHFRAAQRPPRSSFQNAVAYKAEKQLPDFKNSISQVVRWGVPFEVTKYPFGIYPVIKLIPMMSTFTKLIERFDVLQKYHTQGKINLFAPTNAAFFSLSVELGIPPESLFEQLGDLILNKILLQHISITKNAPTFMKIITEGGDISSLAAQDITISNNLQNNEEKIQVSACCLNSSNKATIIYGVEFDDCFLWVLDGVIETLELAALIENR